MLLWFYYWPVAVAGAKRGREDDKSEKEIDPRDAPDPEEPEGLDEEEIKKMSQGNFVLAQDDPNVTLDPCEFSLCNNLYTVYYFPFPLICGVHYRIVDKCRS